MRISVSDPAETEHFTAPSVHCVKTKDLFWSHCCGLKGKGNGSIGVILLSRLIMDAKQAVRAQGEHVTPGRIADCIESPGFVDNRVDITVFYESRVKFKMAVKHRLRAMQSNGTPGATRLALLYEWKPSSDSSVGLQIAEALRSNYREKIVRASTKGMTPELFAKLCGWRLQYNNWRDLMEQSDKTADEINKTEISSFVASL